LDTQLEAQRQKNLQLKTRNNLIAQEVKSLKTNLGSIEEKARKDLGMIKQGETFYLVIDKKKSQPSND
jgi:cell division protein FtsB